MTAAVKFTEDYNDSTSEFWHEAAVVGWRPDLKVKFPQQTFWSL